MAWKIEFTKQVEKTFAKIDKNKKKRITDYLKNRALQEPRSLGKSLSGGLSGLWRYRVGDYRIICEIQDKQLLVLVVEVGHRKEIYKH